LIFSEGVTDEVVQSLGVPGTPITSLKLVPYKAYRRLDDPITINAVAVDANNDPVAGAKVVYSVAGDCKPETLGGESVVTTVSMGVAAITVSGREPGMISVVAAGVNVNREPGVTKASHIFHCDDRRHADEREREYYRRG
jgi:hypothetical protein